MTNLRPIDRYNTFMNMEASSYSHGSWITYEDMQIDALYGAIVSCDKALLFGFDYIKVEDILELIAQLKTQSNQLKENKQ